MELQKELLHVEELEARLEMEATEADAASCTVTSTCTITPE